MPVDTLTRDRLRQLAELRAERGCILSVFLNLDPAEFATPAARASAITSVLTEAEHKVDEHDGLDHQDKSALREDVERVREVLEDRGIAQDGTRGVAVFANGAAGLLEVVRLSRAVENRVMIEESAFVEPLVELGAQDRWCVLLANRRAARIFLGPADGLEETDRIEDDVHSRHDQGGWSQARYQRGVEKEVEDHLRHAADVLFSIHKLKPIDKLLLGAPEETVSDLEDALHDYLRRLIKGRLQLDVENSSAEDVRAAAQKAIEEHAAARERDVLDRLAEGIGRNERAVAGLAGVLGALNEARVEILLIAQGYAAAGARDAATGMLAEEEGPSPAGGRFDPVPNVVEDAIQKAMEQNAEVLVVRRHDDLERHERIAAILRF